MESIRPIPGTVSPRAAVRTPSGPSRTAVPPRTSRTVQPSIVVGRVSATATIGSRVDEFVFACVLAESTARRLPPGDGASGFAKGADVDAVLRALSLLPLDLTSGTRREAVSVVWVIRSAAGIFTPHAHPNPTP